MRRTQKSSSQYLPRESQVQRRSITPTRSTQQYLPFLQRVEIQQRLKEDRLKQEVEESFLYDQKNGQKLFKPSINSTSRSRGGLSIGDYLYKKSAEESIVQFEAEDSQYQKKQIQSERSNQLVIQMRKKRLEDFFNIMDSDNDGFISSAAINLDDLPTEALELLQPIILQLEQLDIYLNLETWTKKCLDVIERMSVQDKNRLFNKINQKSQNQQNNSNALTFRPQLNQVSKMIINRKNQGPCAQYFRAMKENLAKEQKISQIKAQKELKEAQECTFHPKILTKRQTAKGNTNVIYY